jgi:hypothetical protein
MAVMTAVRAVMVVGDTVAVSAQANVFAGRHHAVAIDKNVNCTCSTARLQGKKAMMHAC